MKTVPRGHLITSAVEHPAVLEVVIDLDAHRRIELSVLGVGADGRVDPEKVERAIGPRTRLVSVMLANNEVGTVQPIREIAEICRRRRVLLHTDAAQAMGKIPVDVQELGVDLLSIAGHKLYAPKGVGALFVRQGVEVEPVLFGAGHERGLRPGTENVLEIVGLGAACRLVKQRVDRDGEHSLKLRDQLRLRLREVFPSLVVNSPFEGCLPNTLSVAFPGIDAQELLSRLSNDVAASAGAACHSGGVGASHVLSAMGVAPELARSTVRFSVGRFSTEDELEAAVRRLAVELAQLAEIQHERKRI